MDRLMMTVSYAKQTTIASLVAQNHAVAPVQIISMETIVQKLAKIAFPHVKLVNPRLIISATAVMTQMRLLFPPQENARVSMAIMTQTAPLR